MNPTPHDNATDSDSAMSPQIKKRIAIAGALALVALAAIPVIDSFSKPDTELTPASTPVSSGKIIQKDANAAQPVLTLEPIDSSAPAQVSASEAVALPGPPAAPAAGSPGAATQMAPATLQTPAPAVIEPATPTPAPKAAHERSKPVATAPARTPPAQTAVVTAAPASIPPSKPAPLPAVSASKAPAMASGSDTPPSRPALPLSPPARIAQPVAPAGSSFGYQVQLGLFSSPSNAEKLIDDLKKRGISARTETRVQMGPFRTRAEAEEAMQQLKALGYQPLLLAAGQR